MQEIRYLARLKSEYIVTYNHSWVEVNLKEEKTAKTDKRFDSLLKDESVDEDEDDYVFSPWRKDVDDSVNYSSINNSESSIEFYCSETEKKKAQCTEMKMAIEKNIRKTEINKTEQQLLIGNKTFM